jgi:hypothetical protein
MSTVISPKARRVGFTEPDEFSAYVRTHCPNCIYGWMRTNPEGDQLLVCVLDRETVYPNLEDCSRYELRKGKEPGQ